MKKGDIVTIKAEVISIDRDANIVVLKRLPENQKGSTAGTDPLNPNTTLPSCVMWGT